jgi:putative phage-type endonuclease
MNTKENMDIITLDDLNHIIDEYDNVLYDNVRMNQDISPLSVNIYTQIVEKYKLVDKEDDLSMSRKLYFQSYVMNAIHKKVLDYENRIKNRIDIVEKVERLKLLKLPEQRSEEWYKIREGILTASSLADAIGEGHFCPRDELIMQKCGGPRGSVPFEIVEWGVMYEPVATSFYEKMNQLTILEFGLVPHPTFKIFGASPDGICDVNSPPEYVGRMLEIKCPPRRVFTKEVPRHYWMQMQGQLESCDLEECDFLQVKFIEYFTEQDYIEDIYLVDNKVKEGYSSNSFVKGLLIAFIKDNPEGNPTIQYEYCDFESSYDSLKVWSEKSINDYKDGDFKYDRVKLHWWKIERYECTLVGRDREWWLDTQPKIIDFWEDVLHYREVGIQELIDKKTEKKTKRIKIKKDKLTNVANGKAAGKGVKKKTAFEIDKSVVDKIQNNYLILSDDD